MVKFVLSSLPPYFMTTLKVLVSIFNFEWHRKSCLMNCTEGMSYVNDLMSMLKNLLLLHEKIVTLPSL
jgi:hypothetical protein